MIIWGSRSRHIPLGQGQFFCPRCQAQREYSHSRVARYFHLYFIPLFETGNLGEYVACLACGGEFGAEALNQHQPTQGEQLALATRRDLDGGTPLHMVKQKLINGGMQPQMAKQFLALAAESPLGHCPKCNFYYRHTVQVCSGCGGGLRTTKESKGIL